MGWKVAGFVTTLTVLLVIDHVIWSIACYPPSTIILLMS